MLTKAYSHDGIEGCLDMVLHCYTQEFGRNSIRQLETQANLLWMVREQEGNKIKRWTLNNRDEWFDISKGVICENPKNG